MKLNPTTVIKAFSFIALSSLFLSACDQQSSASVQANSAHMPNEVKAENIRAHIEFLADDTLQGRDTGSHGYQIAANYVKSYFKQIGLTAKGAQTANLEVGFEQPVRFRRSYLVEDSAQAIIHSSQGDIALAFKSEFLTSASSVRNESVITAETVFAGYGVISEEFGYNDYQDIDVKGKIVVVLTGRPDDLPSEEGAHIGSGAEKRRHAAEHGAVGLITIHTPKREKIRSFVKSAKYADTPRLHWLTKDDLPFGVQTDIIASAYVHHDAAKSLFAGAERSLAELYASDMNNTAIAGFLLPHRVTLKNRARFEEISSPNIIATLPGSDAQLKHEYVVYSAHLDHIGVNAHGDEQDTINNGALDNASGVAILLETARLLAEMPTKPKRSVLFVVVTGEEKGLLGSSYFANNPTVPATKLVANVNLDMPLILYPFADVIAFGSTHSTLGEIVANAAGKVDISLSEDPMPEQALFTRSDHYSFVKAGIPSVFLMTGFKSTDDSLDGAAIFADFLKNHYHQHSDEITLPINYDAAASFALVNMMIGLEIANQSTRPQWHEGDFFGVTFAQ
ncbi:Zn-dependent amino-or carboxypeptidase, M28 family [Colwellia chukchiensis]|uniref:Zn-dependent amino-or carboxypeptidase, M28 family n=1 Tax=Colwellia chukchiensis TaxID=641665 RepID=A0A1H7L9D5_9GAMM|nr:M28 family metallopeptidase [Colwellia chukchiensis]SEK95095.1 Zn-dependent amino-or carboxypeptidase, M28 family [Colwellia chukchiensis]